MVYQDVDNDKTKIWVDNSQIKINSMNDQDLKSTVVKNTEVKRRFYRSEQEDRETCIIRISEILDRTIDLQYNETKRTYNMDLPK